MTWFIVLIALTGTVLNARKKRVGFLFWIVSNSYMSLYNYTHQEYALAILFAVYTALAIYGLFKWK